MDRIRVYSGLYKISDIKDNQSLYTLDLDRGIAFTLYSEVLQKVALARNLNDEQCVQLFREINKNNILDGCMVSCCMIGGDTSTKTEQYVLHLLNIFVHIENTNINLIGYDVGDRIHPNSMEIYCGDGSLHAI
ncbi:unnamed protein product [Adineta steineri]|uniref:Uncharacterized protein n=1 Tax=Adineta steineri TaxID=433720 RepID=A0A816ASZ0_9BILA|nr:unnamed protein product [Adineta steineri]CAF1602208.1 unnamed protein product [Adineta steineri]